MDKVAEALKKGKKKYKSKKYPFITNSDLEKYAPNMNGVKVSTVATVGELDSDEKVIKAHLTDGFMFSILDVGDRFDEYSSFLKEDDKIAILGKIDGLDNYKLFGKSIKMKKCYIFAYGDDVKHYEDKKTSKKLSEYTKVTENVADSGSDVSEEEYKALCKTLDYEDILRNPDSNKKKYCKVSGEVEQIIEGFFGLYSIYVTDHNGNKWECSYKYKEGESHVLEGDDIVVFGKCDGTTTATTLLGKQVTLPEVDVEYIE